MRKSVFDGVTFYEGTPDGFTPIQPITSQLNSAFGQDHLKSLSDVKQVMASQAKKFGGDVVANFQYGQRNGSVWKQLWSIDNMLWFGSGIIGKISNL